MLKSNAELIQITCEEIFAKVSTGEEIEDIDLLVKLGYIKGLAETYIQQEKREVGQWCSVEVDKSLENEEPELQGSEAKDFI